MNNDKSMIEILESINETLKRISQTLLIMSEYLSEDERTKEMRVRTKKQEEIRKRTRDMIEAEMKENC